MKIGFSIFFLKKLQKHLGTWQISAKAPCKYGQIYQNCGKPFPSEGIECPLKVLGGLRWRLLCILEIVFCWKVAHPKTTKFI